MCRMEKWWKNCLKRLTTNSQKKWTQKNDSVKNVVFRGALKWSTSSYNLAQVLYNQEKKNRNLCKTLFPDAEIINHDADDF